MSFKLGPTRDNPQWNFLATDCNLILACNQKEETNSMKFTIENALALMRYQNPMEYNPIPCCRLKEVFKDFCEHDTGYDEIRTYKRENWDQKEDLRLFVYGEFLSRLKVVEKERSKVKANLETFINPSVIPHPILGCICRCKKDGFSNEEIVSCLNESQPDFENLKDLNPFDEGIVECIFDHVRLNCWEIYDNYFCDDVSDAASEAAYILRMVVHGIVSRMQYFKR
ncbi:MAG: hypothetical protein Q9182_002460 [Xanthomendoza sp. 2 TL-2023]